MNQVIVTEQEFVQKFYANKKIVHKVCNLYMDNTTDREDLFQEISLQAWKSFKTYRGEAQFSTWLYRVALNTAVTFFRKEKKQLQTSFTEVFPEIVNVENNIETQVQAMYKSISDLNKIEKALVMLYLEDYSYIEIGETLGISPNNVAVKMNRLKIKLKEDTEKYYQV